MIIENVQCSTECKARLCRHCHEDMPYNKDTGLYECFKCERVGVPDYTPKNPRKVWKGKMYVVPL